MSASNKHKKVKKQKCGFVRTSSKIPPIVEQSCAYLEQKALQEEGLFRIPGSVEDIQRYKEKFDRGKKVNLLKEENVHTVSGVLKLFFAELPEPIFTYQLYNSFMAAADISHRIPHLLAIRKVLDVLPPGNKAVVKRVIALFKILSSFKDVNLMTSNNIALVLNINMFREREGESIMAFMSGASSRVLVVEHMIDNYETLFIEPKDKLEEELAAIKLSFEEKFQYSRFFTTFRKDSIDLAEELINEGETVLSIQFDDEPTFNDDEDEDEVPTPSNEIEVGKEEVQSIIDDEIKIEEKECDNDEENEKGGLKMTLDFMDKKTARPLSSAKRKSKKPKERATMREKGTRNEKDKLEKAHHTLKPEKKKKYKYQTTEGIPPSNININNNGNNGSRVISSANNVNTSLGRIGSEGDIIFVEEEISEPPPYSPPPPPIASPRSSNLPPPRPPRKNVSASSMNDNTPPISNNLPPVIDMKSNQRIKLSQIPRGPMLTGQSHLRSTKYVQDLAKDNDLDYDELLQLLLNGHINEVQNALSSLDYHTRIVINEKLKQKLAAFRSQYGFDF